MSDWAQYEGKIGTDPRTGAKFIVQGGRPVPMQSSLEMDPKKFAEAQGTATSEALMSARATAKQLTDLEQRARAFARLNQRTETGPLADIQLPLWAGGAQLGTRAWGNMRGADQSAMNAITQKMVPFAPRTPGTITDFETRSLQLQQPNINYTGPVNTALVEDYLMMGKLARDRATMMDAWVKRNGSLVGFEEHFADYENRVRAATTAKNPDFAMPRSPSRQQRPPTPSQALSEPPPQQRLTPEQARRLPRGTRFIGTDGVERVVK